MHPDPLDPRTPLPTLKRATFPDEPDYQYSTPIFSGMVSDPKFAELALELLQPRTLGRHGGRPSSFTSHRGHPSNCRFCSPYSLDPQVTLAARRLRPAIGELCPAQPSSTTDTVATDPQRRRTRRMSGTTKKNGS